MSSNIERFIERRLGELTAENTGLKAEVERLGVQRDIARKERDRALSQREALRSALDQVANFASSRQALAMEMLAMPGEGGGA